MKYIWGLLFAVGLTIATTLTTIRSHYDIDTYCIVNMIIYAVSGIHIESSLICSIAVLFLMFYIVFGGEFGLGFRANFVPTATFISGVVTCVGSILEIKSTNTIARLFVPGMLWFGSFVFFCSLLIISSSMWDHGRTYIYLMEKYCEFMPNKIEVWAWMTLIIGLALYMLNMHYRVTFEKYGLKKYFNPMFRMCDKVE